MINMHYTYLCLDTAWPAAAAAACRVWWAWWCTVCRSAGRVWAGRGSLLCTGS